MAQDTVLTRDDYERRYLTTTDTINTVLADAYLNKFKRELEINEVLTVRIGSQRHKIRIIQIDPFVKTARDLDEYIDSRIAYLETGSPPPDPPDPEDPALVNGVLDNNKLEANLTVSNYTTESNRGWIIVVDSATVPTNDAVIGVSPPTGFTPGDWPRTNFLSSYASSEDWYFYEYDDVEGIVLVKSTTGPDFITIAPNDTLGPVWLAGLAGFSIDDNGAYTIVAPVDAGIGLAAANTYDIYVDGVIHLANTTALTGSVSVAAGVHTAYAEARDELPFGNIGQSDTDSFSIAVQTAGTVSLPLVTQEVAEDLGAATTITLTRTGGTAAFDIDVSTRDITAVAGTNYTAISSQTVSFAEDDLTKTFNFTPADVNAVENNVCNIEIDYDSADVAAGTVEVGTESVLMKIIGTGLTANAGYQMTTATPFYASFQAESYNDIRASIETGQTSDQWVETGTDVRYAPEAGVNKAMEFVSANKYGDDTPTPKIDPNGPYLEYDVHFTAEAVAIENAANSLYHVFARSEVKSTWNTSLLCTLVNPIVSISVTATVATITTLYSHALSAGDLTWYENVTGTNAAEYNSPGGIPETGLTVATAPTNKTFTVTGMTNGDPDAGTGNLLGSDPDAIRFKHPTGAENSLVWIDKDGSALPLFVDEAATRQFRVYALFQSNLFDAITIAGETQAWAVSDVNVTNNGGPGAAGDDNMGHVQSIYSSSSSGTPPDNPANPEFPYLPLPTATVASLSC